MHLRSLVSRGRIAESAMRVLSYFDEFDGDDSGGPSMISRTDRGINGGLAQMIINLVQLLETPVQRCLNRTTQADKHSPLNKDECRID
jgi:hypothetical protein